MRGGIGVERMNAGGPRNRRSPRADGFAAFAGIAFLACASGVPSPMADREAASIALEFVDPSPAVADSQGEVAAGGFDDVDATVSLEHSTAPAEIELHSWPPGSGRVSRIDVDLKRKHRFLGMRRFVLRKESAADRAATAWVYEHLRQEGILAPRVRSVRLRSNGNDWGIVAAEERVAKELLESQLRREGVTFGFETKRLPTVELDVDGKKKVRGDPKLDRERENVEALLQAYLRGDLPLRDVFDVELLARFLSVAEFWGAAALVQPEHLRFYFNPITQHAEPIGWMGEGAFDPDLEATTLFARPWPAQLLADPELRAAVGREDRRIADSLRDAEGLAWMSADAGGAGTPPARAIFLSIDRWVERSERLAEARRDSASRDPGGAEGRLLPMPGADASASNPIPTTSLSEALRQHPFLEWDESRGVLQVRPGDWVVDGSLVVPPGMGLEMGAGTSLAFASDAFLLATGPLRFTGTEAEKVVLRGRGEDGAERLWQGLVVLHSSEPHFWKHVVVEGTTGIERDGWSLTAGATIRSSDIRIEESAFRGNRTEDALNLIRSRFELRGVSISDAASDAFDCDHGSGSITGGTIREIQGDGVDVSGSSVRVDGVLLEEIRDKALSVGEGSHLEAHGLRIRDVGTAVAGKDGSDVIFEDSQVSDVRHVAIMAYTKKNEYGPARVRARNVQFERVGREAVAQTGNIVAIDGVELPSEAIDIEALYDRGYMKK